MPEQIDEFETSPPPDLAQIRPANEGGAIALSGLKYQYHYAAKLCLEMIDSGSGIEYVACELHDDIVVKLRNNKYKFYQAKRRTGSFWTINRLKDEGVLNGFLECKRYFGEGHSYWFVTDQDCTNRISSNQPDLGRWQRITEIGEGKLYENELNDVPKIVEYLENAADFVNKAEVEALFWATRILKKISKRELILQNLQEIEQIFYNRGIQTDLPSRKRIYRILVSLIEERVEEDFPEATLPEKLENRKVIRDDVENCLSNSPFVQVQAGQFNLDVDPEHRDLRRKLTDARFPEPLKLYFIESRNNFTINFRKDFIHASNYLRELRWKVYELCIEIQLSAQIGLDYKHTYNLLREDLNDLAIREAQLEPTVQVDFDYLHGMVCQLTAECYHEWFSVGR